MTDQGPLVATKQQLLDRAARLAGPGRDHREAASISTQQRDQAILALDDAGVPVGEIATAAGLSRTRVYQIIEREHIRRRAQAPVALEAGQPDVA